MKNTSQDLKSTSRGLCTPGLCEFGAGGQKGLLQGVWPGATFVGDHVHSLVSPPFMIRARFCIQT